LIARFEWLSVGIGGAVALRTKMPTARSFMRIPSKAAVQKIFAEVSKVPTVAIWNRYFKSCFMPTKSIFY
jgi:hypothetical protein